MAAELSPSAILSASTETLTKSSAGYSVVHTTDEDGWPTEHVRVFEDPFSVVAICVFDTWSELVETWPDAQAAFVQLLSAHLTTVDPKAWDGYLVLLTSASREEDEEQIEIIRYDTGRVRKLVSTAPELQTLDDVERALLPLLPLVVDLDLEPGPSALELLGETLEQSGIDPELVAGLFEAFAEQRPLIEKLYELGRSR